MLSTPVALCIFDRPDLTELVFREIAQAKPRRLFVFADGPRSSVEAELCAQALAVTKKVDWDCEVHYEVSEVNLGTRRRMASGIDWVFSEVDEALVLEDDCVPDPTFFPFCEAMLERYRDDPRVMMVSGSNYLERWKEDRQSYHFSHFGCSYGWATWKRAWHYYDITMAAWGDEAVRARIRALLADEEVFAIQAPRFDRRYADTEGPKGWDIPWTVARLAQAGIAVVPALNLVTNVGNVDGRGVAPSHPVANLRVTAMPFPLRLPAIVTVDRAYDKLHVRCIAGHHPGESVNESRSRVPVMRRRIARALPEPIRRVLRRISS